MRRFVRRARRSGSKKRRSEWGGSYFTGINLSNVPGGSVFYDARWVKVPAGVVNHATTGLDHEPEDWTLTRSLPTYGCFVAASEGGFYNFTLAAGLIVWESTSDADPEVTGGNAIAFPTFDFDADWIWTNYQNFAGVLDANDRVFVEPAGNDIFAQSRAMRKFSARQGMALVIGCDNSLGDLEVTGFSYTWESRHHFKLP